MSPKSKEQLERELLAKEVLDELEKAKDLERDKSNRLYALKIVEKIVFGAIGLICMAVLAALLKTVILGQ